MHAPNQVEDPQAERIITEVLKRLLPHLGADGSRGPVIAVFTGATVGSSQAAEQLRSLILSGFEVNLVFTEMADHLYGDWMRSQLAGFPCWCQLPPVAWFKILKQARAVVAPLLSVNSLSKLALMIGDNQATNILLHALFTGTPLIAATNGYDPATPGRAELGFHRARPELNRLIAERARAVASYGCQLVDINQLAAATVAAVPGLIASSSDAAHSAPSAVETTSSTVAAAEIRPAGALVSAADINRARLAGAVLRCPPGVLVTPLARELAERHGIQIVRE